MIVKYFEDTDTLYLQFNTGKVHETRDLDENTSIEIDKKGRIVSMTVEHAKSMAAMPDFSFQRILKKSA